MSDSYYELVDAADELGEKFVATDLVRSTWSAAIQHGAPRLGTAGSRTRALRSRATTPG